MSIRSIEILLRVQTPYTHLTVSKEIIVLPRWLINNYTLMKIYHKDNYSAVSRRRSNLLADYLKVNRFATVPVRVHQHQSPALLVHYALQTMLLLRKNCRSFAPIASYLNQLHHGTDSTPRRGNICSLCQTGQTLTTIK